MAVANTSTFTMSLLSLPNELILDISKYLSPKELNHLLKSNHRFALLLTPVLHRLALQDINMQTALKWAVNHGHENLVRLLLQMGVDVNDPGWDPTGETALHIAVKLPSRLELARILLENGANVDEEDYNRRTPLLLAAGLANEPAVRLLLDYHAHPMGGDSGKSYRRVTPLHKAAGGCGASIVALMIERGGDLEVEDEERNQPLHFAIMAGQVPVVRLLLVEYKAIPDPGALQMALEYSEKGPEREIIRLLLKYGAGLAGKKFEGWFPLHRVRDADVAVLLMDNGARINDLDFYGRNALHREIYQLKRFSSGRFTLPPNKVKIAKAKDLCMVYLERGADIHIKDIYGMTVLDIAMEIKSSEGCAALLELFPNHLEDI